MPRDLEPFYVMVAITTLLATFLVLAAAVS